MDSLPPSDFQSPTLASGSATVADEDEHGELPKYFYVELNMS